MNNTIDLTKGKILPNIIKFTLPLIATSFINMAYTFIDMICIGKIGSGAVASVGTAGFFLWFANSSASMSRIGAQVLVSQSFGKKDFDKLRAYEKNAIVINVFLGTIIGIIFIVLNSHLISFFNLGNSKIINDAKAYLYIVALSMPFMYSNPVISANLNSVGNSKTPFIVNSIGLISNIILDIILIFGFLGFPQLNVIGAAIATAFSQVIVFFILIFYNSKLDDKLKISKKEKISLEYIKKICKIGFAPAIQSTLYCCYSIILARIISNFGAVSIAVQKIGSQIESISWMTADGLAIVATAFIGQNFAIKNESRIKKGIIIISGISLVFGTLATILLIFFGENVFKIFISDKESINGGIDYLRILGYSQIFMCLEIVFIGIFNGHGKTKLPSMMSIIITGARIPIALLLTSIGLGVDGVWWAISGTSIIKGISIPIAFYLYKKDLKKYKGIHPI